MCQSSARSLSSAPYFDPAFGKTKTLLLQIKYVAILGSYRGSFASGDFWDWKTNKLVPNFRARGTKVRHP